jgi:nucleoside-diphosphate-sugar epimerase
MLKYYRHLPAEVWRSTRSPATRIRGHVNPIGERACYDEGKRAEPCFLNYHKQNVKIKIIRIFNTYGPKCIQTMGA